MDCSSRIFPLYELIRLLHRLDAHLKQGLDEGPKTINVTAKSPISADETLADTIKRLSKRFRLKKDGIFIIEEVKEDVESEDEQEEESPEENSAEFECSECHKTFPRQSLKYTDDIKSYCGACWVKTFILCEHCKRPIKKGHEEVLMTFVLCHQCYYAALQDEIDLNREHSNAD